MTRRRWLVSTLALLAGAVLAYAQPWQPRLAIDRRGGEGPPYLVLLHGERSTPAQLLPLARSLGLPAAGRILLPEAPDGFEGRRVWWDLVLALYRGPGDAGVDLTSIDPAGMERAARLVRSSLHREDISPAHLIVLGGFSQGALVASEVAFNSDEPLAALVLLSGTYVDSTGWGWKAAKRRGLPVFMAHGRQDDVFPFEQAERLAQKLARGQGEGSEGVDVTFVAFEGGHEITPEVERALAIFLARVRERRWLKLSEQVPADAGPPGPSNVKEVRNFPQDLPRCGPGATVPLEPGLALVGQKVTFTGTLSVARSRFCTLAWCSGGCCNDCGYPFEIGGLRGSYPTVAVARSVIRKECEPVPSIERFVQATGVLVIDEVIGEPPYTPSFLLQDANLCVIGPWR